MVWFVPKLRSVGTSKDGAVVFSSLYSVSASPGQGMFLKKIFYRILKGDFLHSFFINPPHK